MSSTTVLKFDELLAAFAQNHTDIESLFDSFFLWLRMRTDLFHIRKDEDTSKGFKEGEAEKILLKVFHNHQKEYFNSQTTIINEKKDEKNIKEKPENKNESNSTNSLLSHSNTKNNNSKNSILNSSSVVWISKIAKLFYKNDINIKSTINEILQEKGKCTKVYWPDDPNDVSLSVEINSFEGAKFLTQGIKEKNFINKFLWTEDTNSDSSQYDIEAELITYTSDPNINESENSLKDDSNLKHINAWNGAVTKEYVWSQTIDEVSLEFYGLQRPVYKSDINLTVDCESFELKHKDNIVKTGKLFEKINKNDLIWSIEDNSRVLITLFKMQERWWSCLFIGDETIDTSKIESVKHISDYDQQTQAQVHKMVLEQSLKLNGKNSLLNPY